MKKNNDLIFVWMGVAVVIIVGLIIRNNPTNSTTSLKMMIATINRQLPQKGFEGYDYFTLEKVVMEGNSVVWECSFDPSSFSHDNESALSGVITNGGVILQGSNLDDLLDIDEDFTNNLFKKFQRCTLLYNNLIANELNKSAFYEEMKKQKCSQIYRTYSPFSNRKIEVVLTYDEQINIEAYCRQRPKEALAEFLSLYVQRQNAMLSVASDEDGVAMNMVDEGANLVFRCVFDETYSEDGINPIEYIRQDQAKIESAIIHDIESKAIFFNTKRICNKTGKGYIVRYVDWYNTDSLDIQIYQKSLLFNLDLE